jgi:hypothetical protein
MPHLRFLFVGSGLCLQLPSDSTSRWTPLPLANSSYCQACSGLTPPSYCPCRAHGNPWILNTLRFFSIQGHFRLRLSVTGRRPLSSIPADCVRASHALVLCNPTIRRIVGPFQPAAVRGGCEKEGGTPLKDRSPPVLTNLHTKPRSAVERLCFSLLKHLP